MIKRTLLLLAKKIKFFAFAKRLYQRLRDTYINRGAIEDKLVVFESFRSTKFSDSPRAIYEYMIGNKEYDEYRFIWAFENPNEYRYLENDRTKVVKHESYDYYRSFAHSKYWVINGWIPLRIKKRRGQVALQCWHGTPLKKLRYDIDIPSMTLHKQSSLRDNDEDILRYDYFISPSKYATQIFKSAFNMRALGKEEIMLETGYPRNDRLVIGSQSRLLQYKKKFGIPMDKKILLYAPTWRDDQYKDTKEAYGFDICMDFKLLQDLIGKDWVVLFRAHGLVSTKIDLVDYRGFVYDVSDIDEISDLYLISDLLVTDYSSVFFDYAVLRRPIIFYMYDFEHYKTNLRGLYLNIEDLPGDVVGTTKRVAEIVMDVENYTRRLENRYRAFAHKFNCLEDGYATKRVVDAVFRS